MISLSNRTLIGTLLLEQKPVEQMLAQKMMATRLLLVADAQIILESNTGQQFLTCKPDRKTEKGLFSISQSIVFYFLKVV